MKFTLGWLKEHLDTDAALNEITDRLTALGLEVESVQDRAALFAPFRAAKVEKADKHPDADRLRVCIVDTGAEKLQVVCGAPNARAGMIGVFAPAGSYIPGTDMTLKKGVIRGQESNGMLVSEREMGLSDAHEGIIELPEGTPIGTPFAALYGLDDPVIEINLTPNRADCAGVRGIARDLAASGLGTLKPLDESPVKGAFESPVKVHLDLKGEAADACPLFVGRYIRGVKNGPSPDWLQKRLKAIGLRPISALVDITNYLSYDLCRPLHVFDADRLDGDIRVRLARSGETLAALNDKTYTLGEAMTVVADGKQAHGLAGVMGGMESACTDGTVNVYLEVAYFDPLRTARTGRALQIGSDARYRFERGIDPAFTMPAADIATRLILSLCGGEASHVVKAGDVPAWQRAITFEPAYVTKLAGFDIPAATQKSILGALGFTVSGPDAGPWQVQPPAWRGDIEGRADLVEEIVRVNGYDNIPPVSLRKDGAVTQSGETASLTAARRARQALAARGLNECITWSFLPAGLADLFGSNDNQGAGALRLVNPISSELDQMRPSILPNLAEAAGRNRDRGFPDAALFEVGPVFRTQKTDGQLLAAAGIRSGNAGPRHWTGPEASRPVDAFDAKADALAVLEACGLPAGNVQITRDAPGWFHPGRSGTLRLGGNVLGYFGALHPALLDSMGIKTDMAGFEIFIDRVPQPRQKGTAKPLLKLSPFQPVARDFAFIVDTQVESEALVRAAKGADKNLIVRADVFDIYTGKGVEAGKKSVALNVVIQPVAQTLTDAEIEALSQKIVSQVSDKTGARLRA